MKQFAAVPSPANLTQWTAGVNALFDPRYATNVVWQDTTSNATYCSASTALSSAASL